MNDKTYFHVYISSANSLLSKEAILNLLNRSRENNAKLGITGLLLYKDGNFMQVIEGSEEAINKLVEKIYDDPRHHGIITLLNGYKEHREFPDWSMGFRDLNSPEIKSLPGFSEFLNTPLTGEEFISNPSRCQKLLLNFKKVQR